MNTRQALTLSVAEARKHDPVTKAAKARACLKLHVVAKECLMSADVALAAEAYLPAAAQLRRAAEALEALHHNQEGGLNVALA